MDYMPVVVQATYLVDYKIRIVFDNEEEKSRIAQNGCLSLSKHGIVFSAILCRWLVNILAQWGRIAPETLYEESDPANTALKIVGYLGQQLYRLIHFVPCA